MYPSDSDLAKALLCHIFSHRGTRYQVRAGSTYRPLADRFGLSEEERTRTRAEEYGDGKSQRAWDIKVQWARNTLL